MQKLKIKMQNDRSKMKKQCLPFPSLREARATKQSQWAAMRLPRFARNDTCELRAGSKGVLETNIYISICHFNLAMAKGSE